MEQKQARRPATARAYARRDTIAKLGAKAAHLAPVLRERTTRQRGARAWQRVGRAREGIGAHRRPKSPFVAQPDATATVKIRRAASVSASARLAIIAQREARAARRELVVRADRFESSNASVGSIIIQPDAFPLHAPMCHHHDSCRSRRHEEPRFRWNQRSSL